MKSSKLIKTDRISSSQAKVPTITMTVMIMIMEREKRIETDCRRVTNKRCADAVLRCERERPIHRMLCVKIIVGTSCRYKKRIKTENGNNGTFNTLFQFTHMRKSRVFFILCVERKKKPVHFFTHTLNCIYAHMLKQQQQKRPTLICVLHLCVLNADHRIETF